MKAVIIITIAVLVSGCCIYAAIFIISMVHAHERVRVISERCYALDNEATCLCDVSKIFGRLSDIQRFGKNLSSNALLQLASDIIPTNTIPCKISITNDTVSLFFSSQELGWYGEYKLVCSGKTNATLYAQSTVIREYEGALCTNELGKVCLTNSVMNY
jgi:hypothetical protein